MDRVVRASRVRPFPRHVALLPPPAPVTTLLVANTGGHLAQLVRLRPRFSTLHGQRVVWVTFDTAQSRAALAGEEVIHLPYTGPRDLARVLSNGVRARRILRDLQPQTVISTGAAIALSVLPLATVMGAEGHYVESAARGDGPSLTGRILTRIPRLHLYTQYSTWAGGRWSYRGSVFDAWQPAPAPEHRVGISRVVVTLGTIEFPFRRLVERLLTILPPGVEVLWQTGATDVGGLPVEGRRMVPAPELGAAIADADVVIGHSGIGSAISALEAGRCPVLVPREQIHGEHVDDHQRQIARQLSERGLAITSSVDDLTMEHLEAAAALRAANGVAPPFELEPRLERGTRRGR